MPSKRFSQHLCVYCQQRQSTSTGDHIFARQFFLEADRANLPKAPACEVCGVEKSRDEHYLTTVLPFGARHAANSTTLRTMVPPRLAKNRRLHRELADNLELSAGSTPMMLPLDVTAVQRLFEKITRGLAWHHWGIYLPGDYDVQCALLSSTGEQLFENLFAMNASRRETADLGNGTFRYVAAQGTPDLHFSVWRYEIYGGLQMTGDRRWPEHNTGLIGCISAHREFLAKHQLA